jgi:hypothetical protein
MRKLLVPAAVLLLALLAGCAVNPVVPLTPVSPVGPHYVYRPYYDNYPRTYYLAPPVFGYYPYGSFGPRYYCGRHCGPRYGYHGGYHIGR